MKGVPRSVPWLATIIAIGIIAILYRLSSHVDHGDLFRVQIGIQELESIDIATNLDVLKLRQRNKVDYDTLAAANERVEQLLTRLEPDFSHLGLNNALTPIRSAWETKVTQMERFKQFNSVLGNSHYHLINLTHQLAGFRASLVLNDLSRNLLIFLAQGDSDDIPLLSAQLSLLGQEVESWPSERRNAGRLLVSHGAIVLSHYLMVKRLADDILSTPFPSALEAANSAYSQEFARAGQVAERYRAAMTGFTLLLIATIFYGGVQLRRSSRDLVRSHRLLDNIADNLGEGIVAFDGAGRLTFVNRRGSDLLGRSAEELAGAAPGAVLFAGDTQGAPEALLRAMGEESPFIGEAWIVAGDGRRFPAAFMGGPLPADQNHGSAGYVASFRDLSEVRNAQARLHLAAHVFDSLSEAMVITDSGGRIQSVNPAFSRITGFSEEEARGHPPGTLLASGKHDHAFYRSMWTTLQKTGGWQGEITNRRKSGEVYTEWLSISAVTDPSGAVLQYIGLFTDITERKEAEAYIHHLAYHDSLTGLANRLLFSDRLENALLQAHRSHRHLAVLMFDLDRFKIVNDTLGHQAGDQLLQAVADRIDQSIREGDTLARLGGDEFALLMPEIRSAVDAASVAHKLLQVLSQSIPIDGQEIIATSSIGIAVYPAHGASTGQLLKNADVALYAAKSAGRNTYRFFNPHENKGNSEQLDLEMALRHAQARQQLLLYYQLQVDSHSGRISGAEALIRWQHPERGLVPPDRFIPLAEESGLIEDIGAWCLETACNQFVRWQAAGIHLPRVAVNVSARQLRASDFSRRLMAIVEATGINPCNLELELTESMLTQDSEQTFALFSDLRSRGIRIAIDDFGTGYSSLNYLAQYPVDVIKIDRSFVRNIEEDNEAPYVVQAVIQLARGLKMETIAEGVETEGQRLRLLELGCNNLQGFLFARPCPPEAIPSLIEKISSEVPAPARQ